MQVMDIEHFKIAIKSGYANLENNKQKVNDLNVFPVPDGDTGTNMSLTMQFAVAELDKSKASSIADITTACSSGALMGARGNSGVILSQLLRGFSKACLNKTSLNITEAAEAMVSASDMAYKAVMKPTEGTILTVAREMAEFARDHHSEYTSGVKFFEDVIAQGKDALSRTPEMLPVLKEAGVVDSGGCGLITVCEGILLAMKGEPVALSEEDKKENTVMFTSDVNSDIEFGYCTEFLLRTDGKESYQKFLIDKLMKLGDSLLVIEDGCVIKIHVHTNEPWNAMKIASTCGDFTKIKIENMREQHSNIFEEANHIEDYKTVEYSSEHVDYVIISVSAGDGISEILKDLGVTYIVEGGQTMNPSTQDFMEVIDNTNADNYIILPNNKNIIMAAEQTKNISEKNIAVVPTKNIPEAISALIGFDCEESLENNVDAMNDALSNVCAGQITYAVRDTSLSGTEIHEGDIIGIIGSDIAVCEKTVDSALEALADKMISEDTEMLSIYYGSDVSKYQAEKMQKLLSKKYLDIDVEVFYGGQPLYYYIVSAE